MQNLKFFHKYLILEGFMRYATKTKKNKSARKTTLSSDGSPAEGLNGTVVNWTC